jgi:hypothetical protein
MLSPETLLRQKYSLSFFTTTLLITLTTQSSLAFGISQLGTVSNSESYFLANPDRQGVTQLLNPIGVTSITRGGTPGFLTQLQTRYQNWTFNTAPNDLAGIFNITTYAAQGTAQRVGAELRLEYIPGPGDPTPLNNSLHWIQRVFNNHDNQTDVHNDFDDKIDVGSQLINPFYDTLGDATETTFHDFSGRIDTENNHSWLADLYLVEGDGPQNVTIYNGIQWGWSNNVQPVPEPLTVLGAGVALGFGALFKKTGKGIGEEKTKQKS